MREVKKKSKIVVQTSSSHLNEWRLELCKIKKNLQRKHSIHIKALSFSFYLSFPIETETATWFPNDTCKQTTPLKIGKNRFEKKKKTI